MNLKIAICIFITIAGIYLIQSFFERGGNYIGMDYRIFKYSPVWELAKAVESENLSKIEKLVGKQKYDINYQDSEYKNTLLILSIWNEDFKSFKKQIDLGADVKIKNRVGTSAIIELCQESKVEDRASLLKLLIKKGADVNDIDTISNMSEYRGYTPIMAICSGFNEDYVHEKIDCINMLLNNGADINYKNSRGQTALTISLLDDNYDVALFLLNIGADPNILAVDLSDIPNASSKTIIKLLSEKDYPQKSDEYKKEFNY